MTLAKEAPYPASVQDANYGAPTAHEPVAFVPLLIMAGSLDDNVLPAILKKFVATYKAAGGDIELEIFEGAVHEWGSQKKGLWPIARGTWSSSSSRDN